MDFSTSDEQHELAALTRRICADHLAAGRRREVDMMAPRFDRRLWDALASAGVLGAGLPAAVGGGDLGLLAEVSVLIELGRAVAPVPYLAAMMVAAAAVADHGSPAQLAALGGDLASGRSLVVAALTEDLSDTPDTPTTRAEPTTDGWLVTGAKCAVPFGTLADLILVPASTDEGVRVFLVRPHDRGVTLEPQVIVDGDTEATLDLVAVPLAADRLLGDATTHARLMERATVGTCAHQLGVLERALELTAAYARERKQFGRPIGSFQAVAQRLADAYIDVEAVRLTTWEAAWRLHEGLSASAELATAKFWAADAGHRVAHSAVHVHGGAGIDLDGTLHRYFTAAKRNEFTLGAATDQLRRLGVELAATPA